MNFLIYFMIYFLTPILILGYLVLRKHYSYWTNCGIVQLKPKYLFGNMSGKFFMDIKTSYEKLKNDKPFYGIYILLKPALVLTDLDLVKSVIIKDFDSFYDRVNYHNEYNDPLSGHLINLRGTKWKNMRSKLTPTFSSGKMKYMFSTVVDLGYRLSETTEQYINENDRKSVEIEIKDLMSRYTTDVIGTCAFGIECNSLKDPDAEFFKVGKQFFTASYWGSFPRFIRNNFQNLAKILKLKEHRDSEINFFKKVVHDTINTREKHNIHRKDFMDLLIEMKNSKDCPISFSDILANCFVFFTAGYETSSSLMTFVLYELAQNLNVQEKVRKEIKNVLKTHNDKLNYESLCDMTYLDQVINETLRLHTPAPCPMRTCTEEYQVPNSEFVIKKGTTIVLPYFMYHLDPDYYDNPNEFNPENFTQEAISARHSMSFLAFGDGPRNCIGLRFGKMESKIGLAILLSNYKFSNTSKTIIPIEVDWKSIAVLAPKGLILNVEKLS